MSLILIVEDNENMAEALAQFISYLAHYHTLISNSAEIALDLLNKNIRPDLILLDIVLPGMDGVDFLMSLKSRREQPTPPVVVLSARSPERVRADLEKHGLYVGDVLQKPISPRELVQRIEANLAAVRTG